MEVFGLFMEAVFSLFLLGVSLLVAGLVSWWLWSRGRRGRIILVAGALIVVAAGIAGVSIAIWAVNRTVPQIPFKAAAWNAGDGEVRGAMTDDLLANHVVGITETQLLALLGPPDRIERGEGGFPGQPIQYQYVVAPFFTVIRIVLEPAPNGTMVVTQASATRGVFQY